MNTLSEGFKTEIQKPVDDVTVATPLFYSVYATYIFCVI